MNEWQNYPRRDDAPELVVARRLKLLENVWSPQLRNHRNLVVYLPPSYESSERRYPVIYMQDGQNLFDRATSFAEEWGVDRVMDTASQDGIEAVVVGIANVKGQRFEEYSPFRDERLGGGHGDGYLDFVLETVKPSIDAAFRTLEEPAATGILGSSMGGLISLYAYFRHPEAFDFAGVMSPAIWFADRAILRYLATTSRQRGRLYIDTGTLEGSAAVQGLKRMRALLLEKGYRGGRDLVCVIEKGGRHDESAWGRRLQKAVGFLLDPRRHENDRIRVSGTLGSYG